MKHSHFNTLTAIAFAIIATLSGTAAELRLANGDVLKGEVISHEGGKIQFASPVLGTIEVDDKLATIVTKVTKQTEAGDDNGADHADSVTSGSAHASHKRDSDSKDKPWRSKIDLGVNWQDGRKDQQDISVRIESERKIQRNQYRLQARYLHSEAQGVTTKDRKDAGVRWRRDFNDRWFSQSDTVYFDDQLKQIDFNVDQNVGVGYRLLTGDHAIANVGGGVTIQYRDAAGDSGAFNPFAQLFQDIKWRLNDRVEVSQEAGALYSPDGRSLQPVANSTNKFSDDASYKLTFNSAIRGQVTESVSVNLRYEYEFDNSILDREARVDQRITTSLGYLF